MQNLLMQIEYKPPHSVISRRGFLMMALCQSMGMATFISLPNMAVHGGTLGHLLGYSLVYLFLGIPLLYMEFVISQFTERDCIDVWKARPCLSHVGYVMLVVQVSIIINNHTYNSFLLHYLLVSFEDPIPFYDCKSHWNDKKCNMLSFNYTVREQCLRSREMPEYCKDFIYTFSEVQYFRYYMMGHKDTALVHIAWRMCLSSIMICIVIYLGNLKERKTAQKSAEFLTVVPMAGYVLFLLGSMVQRGVVKYYEEVMDLSFTTFAASYRDTRIVTQVLAALRIGTGIPLNLGALAAFHSPCYANTVLVAALSVGLLIVAICAAAMMFCPYADHYDTSAKVIMDNDLSTMFEKLPRLLNQYEHKKFWLIISYGGTTLLGMGTNIVLMSHIMDILMNRFEAVEKYPGLFRLVGVTILFLITLPLLGDTGLSTILSIRRITFLITVLIATMECLVFVLWYGLGRFAEDVHFMQGLKPGCFMKTMWAMSTVFLAYVFCKELYFWIKAMDRSMDFLGMYGLILILSFLIGVFLVKIIIAACKKRFRDEFALDASWGPRNLILQRSRAMFSAQAMTKEYTYRQHHLQEGILQRQRAANVRQTF